MWDAQTGKELDTLLTDGFGAAFSPDGKHVAMTSTEGVKVWDTETNQVTLLIKGEVGGYVTYSPDGLRLATGNASVWDLQTGQQLMRGRGTPAVATSRPSARTAGA